MPDVPSYEIEQLRRSIAMLTPGSPSGLSRERALGLLDQLRRLTREREVVDGEADSTDC